MLWTAVQAERAGVQTHKADVRAAADDVNTVKASIDELKGRIRTYMEQHLEELEATAEKDEGRADPPPELAALLEKLSAQKIQYSVLYDKFTALRRELELCR